MRRIINSTYVTLDGVIQNPQDWPSLGGFSDEGNQVQTELLAHCDAVLMVGLLDELRLWVHPFFVGTGTSSDLLYRTGSFGSFELADSTSLGSGIVILTYRSSAG